MTCYFCKTCDGQESPASYWAIGDQMFFSPGLQAVHACERHLPDLQRFKDPVGDVFPVGVLEKNPKTLRRALKKISLEELRRWEPKSNKPELRIWPPGHRFPG